jgi:hypothetical protein
MLVTPVTAVVFVCLEVQNLLQHPFCGYFRWRLRLQEVAVGWTRLTFTERADIARLHDGGRAKGSGRSPGC